MSFMDSDLAFLKTEFGLDEAAVLAMGDDELLSLQEKCFDIEVEETLKHIYEDLSERGKTAVRLVDLIHGPYDSAEFDAEMRDAPESTSA
jgi:hypothetical protein